VGNLFRHAFLNLGTTGHLFDNPGQLTQSYHLSIREIANVSTSREGEQVMLAHATEVDILDQYNLVVLFCKHLLQMNGGIPMETREHLRVHPGDSGWRFQQTFAIRILSDGKQNLANSLLYSDMIYWMLIDYSFGHGSKFFIQVVFEFAPGVLIAFGK
jgi:hypothetical protein